MKINKPYRRGKFYGSDFCCKARFCTWAAFQEATRKANALAKRMGTGWTPHVHENVGWYWEVISPNKTVRLLNQDGTKYWAILGPPGKPFIEYEAFSKIPEEAVRRVLKTSRAAILTKLSQELLMLTV